MRFAPALLLASSLLAQRYNYPAAYPAVRQGGQYMHNYYLPPAPSSTPWWPSWSPDGKFIAFAMHGSIWKVELSTGIATEITYGPKYHSSPDWSPDGKWIIYTADDDARSIQLELLNVQTGDVRKLTSDDQVYVDPVFSPDGSKIAYVSSKPGGHFNIYIRGFAGGEWSGEEVALTSDNRYPRDRLYFGPFDFHTQPAWTPDGKELMFVTNRGVALGSGDIWIMPARADGGREARKVHTEQTLYRTRPHVSLDGKRFLYSSTGGASDQYTNLYVLPTNGGQPYKLTFGDHDHFHPRFSPDGEWIAYISNDGGLPQLWLLETYGGARKKIAFRELRWKRPMGRLHLRVVDGKGADTAARIHFFGSDGKFYAPSTAYARRGRSGMHLFHSQGQEVWDVPPGRTRVAAVKGFEFVPTEGEVEVKAGETAALTLTMRPLEGFDKTGWYSGSTHVHMNYAGNLRNSPDNLIRMSRSEHMDMIMDQVANKDNRIMDYQYFVPGGGEHPATFGDPAVKLHIGQEYRPPFYGHVFFLGLRDHLISPFTTGYEGTGIESLYPSNTDMFRKGRAQGAVNGYVHGFSGDIDPVQRDLGVAKGFGVDLALGTFECLEWSHSHRASRDIIFHAWNNDFRVAPVGGEDSISSLHWTKLVGSVRTYAHTGAERSIPSWLEALRSGRVYMSTGPLLHFTIDGKALGEEIRLPASGGTVTIEARVHSIAPLSTTTIYRNGRPWKNVPAGGLREQVRVDESAWFALYSEGPPYRWLDAEYPQAITNCIRVYTGDRKIRSRESAQYFLGWEAKLRKMAQAWPWWRSEKEKAHVFAQFDEARRVYEQRAAEAP